MSHRADRYWWAYVAGGLVGVALAVAMAIVYIADISKRGGVTDSARNAALAGIIAFFLVPSIGIIRAGRTSAARDGWLLRLKLFAALVAALALCVALVSVFFLEIFTFSAVAYSMWQVALAAILALFSTMCLAVSRTRRKHWRLRQRFIEGNASLIPEAGFVPDTGDVFDVSREPLVLAWRSAPLIRMYNLVISIVLLCAAACATLIMILASPGQKIWSLPTDSAQGVILGVASSQSYLVVLLSVPLTFFLLLILRNRLKIIEATDVGIRFQPLIGRVRLMRWHDIRMLQVDGQNSAIEDKPRSFALYDEHASVIAWHEWESESGLLKPEGITWDEMWALSRELVDVIYQRTGLTPRTFTRSLQRGVGLDSEHARRQAEEGEGVDEVDEVDEGQDAYS